MHRVSQWMRKKPAYAFFALTYLISWPLLIPVLWVFRESMALQGTFGTLAVFAPAFAAMIISRTEESERIERRPVSLVLTFLLSWIIAWMSLIFFILKVRGAAFELPSVIFTGILAFMPAFFFSRAFSTVKGIRRQFRSLVVPRGNIIWYFIALFTFPAVQLAGLVLAGFLNGQNTVLTEWNIQIDPAVAVLMFLQGFFFSGGINEEAGWRGFALPRLQRKFCPLAAALIVWFF